MSKKQEVKFLGIDKSGQRFVSHAFGFAVMNSINDPVPLNRKSKRAMFKIIQGMGNVEEQEDSETHRLQKKKRKKKRKTSYLSKRLNASKRKAS